MATTDDIPDEPDDAGDHEVPADLVELHEVLEWQASVEAAEKGEA